MTTIGSRFREQYERIDETMTEVNALRDARISEDALDDLVSAADELQGAANWLLEEASERRATCK